MLPDYAKSCKHNQQLNAFDYASFMRVLPMRRMFQVLLYAGFMHHFNLITVSVKYSTLWKQINANQHTGSNDFQYKKGKQPRAAPQSEL